MFVNFPLIFAHQYVQGSTSSKIHFQNNFTFSVKSIWISLRTFKLVSWKTFPGFLNEDSSRGYYVAPWEIVKRFNPSFPPPPSATIKFSFLESFSEPPSPLPLYYVEESFIVEKILFIIDISSLPIGTELKSLCWIISDNN